MTSLGYSLHQKILLATTIIHLSKNINIYWSNCEAKYHCIQYTHQTSCLILKASTSHWEATNWGCSSSEVSRRRWVCPRAEESSCRDKTWQCVNFPAVQCSKLSQCLSLLHKSDELVADGEYITYNKEN